ncbi:outer membrane beta-barrel protein [Granulicella tundricola]|uniref:outer membrane beta-barrel protein n=1 Tax=Granulicella tundricola TaxID=940615 RepID=UPI0018DCCF98|nr:outer membrane beta-barrel protein [Granulicella tundricola]
MSAAVACAALFPCASAYGQAVPTATRAITFQVGGGLSLANNDYSYDYIKGATLFGTIDFKNHFGIEGDIHDTSIFTPQDLGETSYLLGVRYKFNVNGFHPYAKVQAGLGTFNFQSTTYVPSSHTYKIYDFGGGVEHALPHRLNFRIVDLEYQRWPGFGANGLTPIMVTTGLAYRF